MDRDIFLMLVGGAIGLFSSLATLFSTHWLSERREKRRRLEEQRQKEIDDAQQFLQKTMKLWESGGYLLAGLIVITFLIVVISALISGQSLYDALRMAREATKEINLLDLFDLIFILGGWALAFWTGFMMYSFVTDPKPRGLKAWLDDNLVELQMLQMGIAALIMAYLFKKFFPEEFR